MMMMMIKFHENTSSGSRVVACGQTDRRTDMTKPVVAFRKIASAPKNNGQKQEIAACRSLGDNAAWYSEEAEVSNRVPSF